MKSGGYIKLFRSAFDHPIADDHYVFFLMFWCVKSARRQPKLRHTDLERGQFRTTRSIGTEQTRARNGTQWYRGMAKLVELGCITMEVNNRETIVTVCNYEDYQDWNGESEQPVNNKRTADEQPSLDIEERNKERPATAKTDHNLTDLAAGAAFDEGWGTDPKRITIWHKHLADLCSSGLTLASLAEELKQSPDSEAPWDFSKRMRAKHQSGHAEKTPLYNAARIAEQWANQ